MEVDVRRRCRSTFFVVLLCVWQLELLVSPVFTGQRRAAGAVDVALPADEENVCKRESRVVNAQNDN